jgi:hypothetical protein
MKSTVVYQVFCTILLLLSNWILLTHQTLFILPSTPISSAPSKKLELPRTADDVARGILAIHSNLSANQSEQLKPLIEQGKELRSQLSQSQGKYKELQMTLNQNSSKFLEANR